MKFNYEYRTSDNVRHTGVIAASDREAAFAALKAQGIRPGCLAEAPGFFNKLFGKGKRWLAIGVLGAALVGSIVYTSIVRPSTSDLQPHSLATSEREQILAALERCGNNKSKAAEELGISRRTIHRKLKEWSLD